MTLGDFANSFKSSWGAASAAATLGPAALLAVGLSPPWPSDDGRAAAGLATLAGVIGLTMAYVNRDTPADRPHTRRALAAAGLLLLAFVATWSLLVVKIPMQEQGRAVEQRYVAGLVMGERAKALKYDRVKAIKLLKLRGTYSEVSLLGGRMALLLPWLFTFGLLTYGFGLQQLRKPRGEDSAESS